VSEPRAQSSAFNASRFEWVCVAAAVLVFVGLVHQRAAAHSFPFYDDVGYLTLGSDVRERGGPWSLLQQLYGASYPEANRHPLYLALLSMIASYDVGYHHRAQLLTAFLGVLALIAFWWVVRKHFGSVTAIIALAWLAISETLIENSSRETCEPLLIALWVLAVSAILDGEKRPAYFALAGVWSGLAFLCKGTAISLPICFVLAMLLTRRARALRDWGFWGFFVGFCVAASPLLVRNVGLYGSPLHNANSRFLWIDRLPDFAEVHAPHADQLLPHGPAEYFAQASWDSIALRFLSGIIEMVFHIGDAMSLVNPTPFTAVRAVAVIVGFLCAAAAVFLLIKRPSSWMRTFLLVQAAWFYAFFAFYDAVSASSRYLIPMTVMFFAVLAEALVKASGARGLKRSVAVVCTLAVIVGLVWPVGREPPGFKETESWLVAHLQPGDTFAIDSRTRLQPAWLLRSVSQCVVSASFREKPVAEEELIDDFRTKGVRYVVLDASSRSSGSISDGVAGSSRYFFYDKVPLASDGSLPLTGYPSAFEIAYADPAVPRRWLVLEMKGTSDLARSRSTTP
jgi:hypothetical protein